MPPYSERAVLPRDSSNSSISVDSDSPQITVDTSPGSLSVTTTPSPTGQDLIAELNTNPSENQEEQYDTEQANTSYYPTPADSMPFDHAFPEFIRQLTNERNLGNVRSLRLRVISRLVSLQRMSLYTTNLRELDLEGSILSSLRDIGCNLKCLQTLKVGNCQLDSLDGTFGLTSLRQLYAQKNQITDVTPCSNLPHIQLIDLSHNRIRNISYAGFLSVCRKLKSIVLTGNPATYLPEYRNYVKRTLPQLKSLDNIFFDNDEENANDSPLSSEIQGFGENSDEEKSDYYNSSFDNEDLGTNSSELYVNERSTSSEGDQLNEADESTDVQEISRRENREVHERGYHLLSLRKERDEGRQFRASWLGRGVHTNFEETAELPERSTPNFSHWGDGNDGLFFPRLNVNDVEMKKSNTENDSSYAAAGAAGKADVKKLKTKGSGGGERSNSFSSLFDPVDIPGRPTASLEDFQMGARPRVLSKAERPATVHNSQTAHNSRFGLSEIELPMRRPATAGPDISVESEASNADDGPVVNVGYRSLTSGIPMCGNLAVALRHRKKYEQDREDAEILFRREYEVKEAEAFYEEQDDNQYKLLHSESGIKAVSVINEGDSASDVYTNYL